jgi:hypothetical protein
MFGFPTPGRPVVVPPSAVISTDQLYRYWLTRQWSDAPPLVWVMLNPSTADALKDDPTIKICMGRARRGNFGGIIVVNAYGLRETFPDVMLRHPGRVGPDNDQHVRRALWRAARRGGAVLCAWGGNIEPERAAAIYAILREEKVSPLCLGVTKEGQPKHPLRIGYAYEPHLFL